MDTFVRFYFKPFITFTGKSDCSFLSGAHTYASPGNERGEFSGDDFFLPFIDESIDQLQVEMIRMTVGNEQDIDQIRQRGHYRWFQIPKQVIDMTSSDNVKSNHQLRT